MFTDTYDTLELMFTNNRYFIQIFPSGGTSIFVSTRGMDISFKIQIVYIYISIMIIDKMKQTENSKC